MGCFWIAFGYYLADEEIRNGCLLMCDGESLLGCDHA